MAVIVWTTIGLACWHFTVFLPDRFWQGIIGALLGSTLGAILVGAIVHIAAGQSIGETDIATAVTCLPGVVAGLGLVWLLGVRQERAAAA